MPPVKGKPRRESVLHCRKCKNRKLKVGRHGNTRKIHGKQKVVAPVECPRDQGGCGNEWWSYNKAALDAMRAADAAAKHSVITDSGNVVTEDTPMNGHDERPVRARPGEVDQMESHD